jgi:hypothetical protein
MKHASKVCLLFAGAAMLALPQAFAQSGVISGPPQLRPSQDDPPGGRRDRDDPPGGRPGLRSQDEPPGGRRDRDDPGGRPGLRSQNEPPGGRPGLRSQDEPPGGRDRDDRRDGWIAVAGGFDSKGRNVGVGYSGHTTSRSAAEDEALRACNGYGKGVRCREAFAVSNGCLYIVPGSRSGGVTWGRGATTEFALDQCRRGGYTCDRKRVVGGCVPGGR